MVVMELRRNYAEGGSNDDREVGHMIKNPLGVLEKSLEGLAERFQATSQNIANMNTPRYARREISFEDQLKKVIEAPNHLPLKLTNERHISNIDDDISKVSPQERSVGYEIYRLDGNNVDPETEMARLAETRMTYQAVSMRVNGKINGLRRVIGGGS